MTCQTQLSKSMHTYYAEKNSAEIFKNECINVSETILKDTVKEKEEGVERQY